MAIGINTNTTSLPLFKESNKANDALSKTLSRIASGLRINSAADDAAGLAIANRFTAQLNQQSQAIQNISAGTSMVQVAEGGLGSITDSLQRMRELAIQSANGTLNASDRQALEAEFSQLQSQISSVIDTTSFNSRQVLNTTENVDIALGGEGESIGVNLRDVSQEPGVSEVLTEGSIASVESANQAIESIDAALNDVNTLRADFGASLSRFDSATRNLENAEVSTASARSRIADADIAEERSNNLRAQILNQSNIAMQAQANVMPEMALRLLSSS